MGAVKMVCPPTVQAHLGQAVVLSCRVEPPLNLRNETLEWKDWNGDYVHLYRSFGDSSEDQLHRFQNRTSLDHQNLTDGNVSYKLTDVTKDDEGNYTFCLRRNVWATCSNLTLTVVLQRNNETRAYPGSALSSGGITGIVVVVVVVLGGVVVVVVLGVAAIRSVRRNSPDLRMNSIPLSSRRPDDPEDPEYQEDQENPSVI